VSDLFAPWVAIQSLIDGGGPLVVWIFLNGVLLWGISFERWWYFSRVMPREADEMFQQWNTRHDHVSWCSRQIRLAMVSRLNANMMTNMPVLQVMVPMAPLLGLIGTVSGMLEVFDSMAIRGSADARTMADGVSHAMICTMTGLAVSISGLPWLHHFRQRTREQTELFQDRLTF
jgi:biopolymer transport protein ExbB